MPRLRLKKIQTQRIPLPPSRPAPTLKSSCQGPWPEPGSSPSLSLSPHLLQGPQIQEGLRKLQSAHGPPGGAPAPSDPSSLTVLLLTPIAQVRGWVPGGSYPDVYRGCSCKCDVFCGAWYP